MTNKENNVNHFMDFNNLNHIRDESFESISITDSDFDAIEFINSLDFKNARTSTPFKLPTRTPSKWDRPKILTCNDNSFNQEKEKKDIKSLKAKIASLENKLIESNKLNEQYKETIHNLKVENDTLQKNNESIRMSEESNIESIIKEYEETISIMKQEIESLKDENERLKDENKNLIIEIEEKNRKMDEYRDEIEGLAEDLKRISNSDDVKEENNEFNDNENNFCFMDMISSIHNEEDDDNEDSISVREQSFISFGNENKDLSFNQDKETKNNKEINEDNELLQLKNKIEIEKQKIEERIREIEAKCESFVANKEKQQIQMKNSYDIIIPEVSSGINEILNRVEEIKISKSSSRRSIITMKSVILTVFILLIGISWPFYYFPCVKRMVRYPYNIYPT